MPTDPIWIALAVVVAMACVALAVRRAAVRARRRAHELTIAADALEAHIRALETVLAEPSLSIDIRRSLAQFSEATSDRRVARVLVKRLSSPSGFEREDERFPFHDELDRLRRIRPELVEEIRTLVTSGTFAMILRWPETASAFERLAEDLVVDQKRGLRLLARFLDFGPSRVDEPGGLGAAPV